MYQPEKKTQGKHTWRKLHINKNHKKPTLFGQVMMRQWQWKNRSITGKLLGKQEREVNQEISKRVHQAAQAKEQHRIWQELPRSPQNEEALDPTHDDVCFSIIILNDSNCKKKKNAATATTRQIYSQQTWKLSLPWRWSFETMYSLSRSD